MEELIQLIPWDSVEEKVITSLWILYILSLILIVLIDKVKPLSEKITVKCKMATVVICVVLSISTSYILLTPHYINADEYLGTYYNMNSDKIEVIKISKRKGFKTHIVNTYDISYASSNETVYASKQDGGEITQIQVNVLKSEQINEKKLEKTMKKGKETIELVNIETIENITRKPIDGNRPIAISMDEKGNIHINGQTFNRVNDIEKVSKQMEANTNEMKRKIKERTPEKTLIFKDLNTIKSVLTDTLPN